MEHALQLSNFKPEKKKKNPTSYFIDGTYKGNGMDYESQSSCFLTLAY